MKLIDANARVTVQSFDIEHEEFEHTEMSVADAIDFCTDEGCPPIINAIPVEWLREWQDEVGTINEWWPIIQRIITVWQEEQEVSDE